jgi:signal transduction histidine kinase
MNSLHACGSTLLDTINHVMDYAKISDAKKSVSSKRLKNANTIRLSSKPLKNRRRKDPAFDLTIATEEVVEAVFSGSSYIPVTSKLVEAPSSPTDEYAIPFPQRKARFIILDMAFDDDWVFSFPIGSWRRIVMNLFGNAIKYTDTGYIHVSLRSSKLTENTNAPTAITLTITDTGSGMSPGFLANRIFHPFSQEDSHAPGTGLGLSIVRIPAFKVHMRHTLTSYTICRSDRSSIPTVARLRSAVTPKSAPNSSSNSPLPDPKLLSR